MSDAGELRAQAEKAVLQRIVESQDQPGEPLRLLYLAEAYAWLMRPDQSHGGRAESKSS